MPFLTRFMILELWFLLIGLLVVVVYQLMTGKINTSGLLFDDTGESSYSPCRVQLLVTTVTAACYYLVQVSRHPSELPLVPHELLLVAGGGNIIYLTGKTISLIKDILNYRQMTTKRR